MPPAAVRAVVGMGVTGAARAFRSEEGMAEAVQVSMFHGFDIEFDIS